MGIININTPQGLKRVRITGDAPTDEEMGKIREAYPDASGQGFDYSLVTETEVTETPSEPTGEVEDSLLRYQLGRMDTDEEKQNLLNHLLGQGTSERVSEDTFIIDQAKVDPRTREKYGLSDTGRIYLDKPGFTWNDIIDFGGEAGPETLAAIGASIAFTGVALLPGMAIVGAAAGLAKATDEIVEWQQGLNRQSAGEVAGMIATSAISNALFEGGGRLVATGVGRLIKGPGPEVSAARIAELEAMGMSPRLAKRAAREEASSAFSQLISRGAKPTIQAATGKSLAARALAVNEKIAPNTKVGRANVTFIQNVIKDFEQGVLSQDQALKMLAENNSSMATLISSKLADPEEAFRLSQKHLDDVVAKELAEYEAKFVPSEMLPQQYTNNLQLSATLFRTEANNLYDVAGKTIGKEGIFDINPIVKTIDDLAENNPFVQYAGSLFDTIKTRAAQGGMGIGELQQLRSALRVARGDTERVSSAAQGGIGKLISTVDDLMLAKQTELAEIVARGYRIEAVPSAAGRIVTTDFGETFVRGSRVSYRKVDLNPAELSTLREGLDQWTKANAFFREGQESFNNTAVNTLLKAAKDKFYTSNINVVDTVVKAGDAPKLAMYLTAVTPTQNMTQKLAQPGATELIENVRRLVDADQFKAAEELVKNSGLEGIIPKVRGFMDDLPANDVFRVSQKKGYLKELDELAQLSRSGASPQMMRESVRNSLAKTWIDQTKGEVTNSLNKFNPSEFASKFNALQDDLQNVLFGKTNAQSMREAMEAFQVSALDEKTALQLFDALPTMTNQSLKAQISALKEITERATSESSDAVLSAVRSGSIDSPSSLVAGLLKNPTSYNRLRNVVGDTELEKVGGVKDMVMNNLIRGSLAKTGFNEATVQSGTWGRGLKDAILAQNKNGALSTILGDDVVKNLSKLADDAIKISDLSIKGYGGIAAAPAAVALIALAIHNPIAAGATLATVIGLSRMMRDKSVLRLLTSPRMRANEYNAAIKAGADLPALDVVKAQGEKVYTLNRLGSIVASEMSLIAGSGILGETGKEGRKAAEQANVRRGESPAMRRLPTPDIGAYGGRIDPKYFDPSRVDPQGGVPGILQQDSLRSQEIRKLLGIQ